MQSVQAKEVWCKDVTVQSSTHLDVQAFRGCALGQRREQGALEAHPCAQNGFQHSRWNRLHWRAVCCRAVQVIKSALSGLQ